MKKVILACILFVALLACYGESRKFICLDNGTCVTVWKAFGNVCYIIPGKYYGLFRPSTDHIKTTNTALVDLYFTDSLPNSIIFRSTNVVEVTNGQHQKFVFKNFSTDTDNYKKLLFEAVSSNKLKPNVDLIFIDIHDSHSVDKNKKRLW